MQTATATRESTITDKLSVRRIDANNWEVESRSITLGSHFVRRTFSCGLVCDRDCRAYGFNYRCSHIASVIRFEQEAMAQPTPATAAPKPKRTLESLWTD